MSISLEDFAAEFEELAQQAGITEVCALDFSDHMAERNRRDPRSFAEVDPHGLKFYFAIQILELPSPHRTGLIMHELGHVLCKDLPGGGTEEDADRAACECFGSLIIYDKAWPGKGLQCAVASNPPYSGYDSRYTQRKFPADPTRVCYKTKRDALNVFLDWNTNIINDYGGSTAKHSAESFEAINHKFDIKGKRRVDSIAKAAWWVLPAGSPYYLEDIDVEILNRTAPAIYNDRGLSFSLPDYAEERRLVDQEQQYWEDKYGGVFPEKDDDDDWDFPAAPDNDF